MKRRARARRRPNGRGAASREDERAGPSPDAARCPFPVARTHAESELPPRARGVRPHASGTLEALLPPFPMAHPHVCAHASTSNFRTRRLGFAGRVAEPLDFSRVLRAAAAAAAFYDQRIIEIVAGAAQDFGRSAGASVCEWTLLPGDRLGAASFDLDCGASF